jgi:tetratricopeptide (TPR) repeat protein
VSKILHHVLVLSLGLTPIPLATLTPQIAHAQSANFPAQELPPELKSLIEQARQQTQQQKHQQAIETFQKALEIARQVKDKDSQAEALLGIGFNLRAIGQPQGRVRG